MNFTTVVWQSKLKFSISPKSEKETRLTWKLGIEYVIIRVYPNIYISISCCVKLSGHPNSKIWLSCCYCSQCDFETYPSTLKCTVSAGSFNRMPSSSGLATTWQPRWDLKRDIVSSTETISSVGFRKKIHIRWGKPKSKVQHIIFFFHRILQFVVEVYILNRAFHIKLNL